MPDSTAVMPGVPALMRILGGILGAIAGLVIGVVIHVAFLNNQGWADVTPFALAVAGVLAGSTLGRRAPRGRSLREDAGLGQCSGMFPERVGQNQPMPVRHTFAGLPVADYTAAYDWYARLLGREADMFPHETECVWRLTPTSSIFVVQDPQRAGSALVTLALDDLDAHERRLGEAGFPFVEEVSGAAPRRLVVSDFDGNRLVFFENPSPTDP